MKSPIDQLTAWLNSAHSMELSMAKVLENHANDAKDFPEMRSRIQQHVEETRRHADVIVECLNVLGEKPSMTKSLMGDVMGRVQGMSTGMFNDELVKNALADYASEHFEIACYRSLISAAEALGQQQIAELCEEILEDEEEMAQWLEEQIPDVTRLILQQEAAKA
jgi:ferritin-like metal-binding protein YciE